MLEIFLGSGFGGLIRYFFSLVSKKIWNESWPGTLFVNFLGAMIMIYLINKFQIRNEKISRMITVGFLGGFTTFSSLSNEVFTKFSNGHYLIALMIVCLNVLLGIIMGILIFRQ